METEKVDKSEILDVHVYAARVMGRDRNTLSQFIHT